MPEQIAVSATPPSTNTGLLLHFNGSRNPRSRSDPLVVAFEFQTEPLVVDRQVTVAPTGDRLRHHLLHFLRYHPDISLSGAVVAEAIETEPVVETTEKNDVVLEHDVRPSSTAAASTTAPATHAAGAHGTATTTGTTVRDMVSAPAATTGVLSATAAGAMRRMMAA